MGDNIQSYALYNIYINHMNIKDDDIVFLDTETVSEKIENDVIYIVIGAIVDILYLAFIEHVISIGRSDQFRFIPIGIGLSRLFHCNSRRLKALREAALNKLILPIGFRDHDTMDLYAELGYPGYINGCITNTLPKRSEKEYDTIYLIDIPKSFYSYIPDHIKNKARVITNYIDKNTEICQQYNAAVRQIQLLRDTAKFVVTVRYHVATPCAAMGIPAIMLENYPSFTTYKSDPRLSALPPNVNYYKHDEWHQIAWEPKTYDIEQYKKNMIEIIIARINNEVAIIKNSEQINKFYMPSKQKFYDTFKAYNREDIVLSYFIGDQLLSKTNGKFKYYLYGLSDFYLEKKECLILSYLEKNYPQAQFLGFVDSYKTGNYFGKEVLKPNDMKIDKDTYCLVSAFSANNFVKQLFEEKGFDKAQLWLMPERALFFIYHL